MTDNMSIPSTQSKNPRWLVPGILALGVLLIIAGVWLVRWTHRAASAQTTATASALARANPAASSTATAEQTRPLPTLVVTVHAPTAVPTRTPSPTASSPTPTPSPLPPGTIELSVVHSNDTWGYTLPCG